MGMLRPFRMGRDSGANLLIVALLAVGLGATALLYTAFDRLLLHPLRVANPDTMVRFGASMPPVIYWDYFSYQQYEAIRRLRSVSDIAAEGSTQVTLSTGLENRSLVGLIVSGNYFSLMGIPAELGRTLNPIDEQATSETIPVLISDRLWKSYFGASRTALGSSIRLQGVLCTVIGVMPPTFSGSQLDNRADVWLPFSSEPLFSNKSLSDPASDQYFSVLGRLVPHATIQQAQSEFSTLLPHIDRDQEQHGRHATGIAVPITQGTFAVREQFHRALRLLLWAAGMLLLILCANVAGLLLAVASRKKSDTAIRVALGATRTKLISHALYRSTFMALAGAGGGLLIAAAGAPFVAALLPSGSTGFVVSLAPDWRIAVGLTALAFCLAVGFSVIPVWHSCRIQPHLALQSRGSSRRSGLVGKTLLIFQSAAAVLLLVTTGMLVHTFYVLRHTNPGFEVEHLLTLRLTADIQSASHLPPDFAGEPQQKIQALPGVQSASLATPALMHRIGLKTSVAITGQKISSASFLNTSFDRVSDSFFETLGIPLLTGRSFDAMDGRNTKPVPTIINEAFARQIFSNTDPLGKTFGMGSPGDTATAANVVVGVVADSKYRSLRESMLPIYYTPIRQQPDWQSDFYLYIRTEGTPESTVQEARQVLFRLAPTLAFSEATTMEEELRESLWQERLLASLASAFSIISVLIVSLGLYGLLSYDVSQRAREFGIRSAVGAQPFDIAALVLKDLLRILLSGCLLGGVAFACFARIMTSALYGVKIYDPASFSAAVLFAILIGTVSGWSPIRRALKVDPVIALKED